MERDRSIMKLLSMEKKIWICDVEWLWKILDDLIFRVAHFRQLSNRFIKLLSRIKVEAIASI